MRDIIEEFQSTNPWEFGYIEKISLERTFSDEGSSPYNIKLELSSSIAEDANKLKLEFLGAIDIRWGNLSSLAGAHLHIQDVSDRQIEGIRFRITDEEEDMFSFYCHDFRIIPNNV